MKVSSRATSAFSKPEIEVHRLEIGVHCLGIGVHRLEIEVHRHSRAGGNPDRGTGFPPARE